MRLPLGQYDIEERERRARRDERITRLEQQPGAGFFGLDREAAKMLREPTAPTQSQLVSRLQNAAQPPPDAASDEPGRAPVIAGKGMNNHAVFAVLAQAEEYSAVNPLHPLSLADRPPIPNKNRPHGAHSHPCRRVSLAKHKDRPNAP